MMRLLTVKDLSRDTKIAMSTWRLWIRQGKVPVVRLGRAVRVTEIDYHNLVNQNRTAAAHTPGVET